jgi:hypothetical protein
MPLTTLDIEGPVLDELKRLQEEEGTSLGALTNSLLAEALGARKKAFPGRRLRWNTQPMGLLLSLEDKEGLQAILDER